MKKNLMLFVIIFLCVGNVFSQFDIKSRTVLNKFVLGYDNEKTLSQKVEFDELSVYTDYDGKCEVTKITLTEYMYKLNAVKVVLLLVDDNLYGVRFYPKNDKMVMKYESILNSTIYNSYFTKKEWFNKYVIIYYNIDGNFEESYVHYDVNLLRKFPQYMDF